MVIKRFQIKGVKVIPEGKANVTVKGIDYGLKAIARNIYKDGKIEGVEIVAEGEYENIEKFREAIKREIEKYFVKN
jgi:acylphosphatase